MISTLVASPNAAYDWKPTAVKIIVMMIMTAANSLPKDCGRFIDDWIVLERTLKRKNPTLELPC